MSETDLTTKKSRRKRNRVLIPTKFRPRFWDQTDQRVATVRLIRKRYAALKRDTGADSVQKDLLCQHVAFLSIVLETQAVESIETGQLDLGSFVQSLNSMQGLLKSLGLERQIKNVTDLSTYLSERKQ